jgi:NAD+ kinase
MSQTARKVLLVTHTGRPAALASAQKLAQRLLSAGIEVSAPAREAEELEIPAVQAADTGADTDGADVELVVVVGGDGSILRGADLARSRNTALLGVNLGRVGFLAEADEQDLVEVADRIVDRAYEVEERVAVEARVDVSSQTIHRAWALNEISVEKAERERMLEIGVEVDGHRLSRWGCDGVVCATPTGSTAYAFSAGGPVVWPEVEALLLVPISAHALFARPLVVAPTSTIQIDLLSAERGVLWADGRRPVALPEGAQITVSRSDQPVRLARLLRTPFTERLVAKFSLPVHGWRSLHQDESS